MRKLLAATAVTAFFAVPAFAETVVVTEEPAMSTSRTTTTTTVTKEIPDGVTTYVRENPIDAGPVLEGRIVNGTVVPADVSLVPVQGYDGYSYFYQDGAPVIVDSQRRVVRIID